MLHTNLVKEAGVPDGAINILSGSGALVDAFAHRGGF